MYDYIEQGSIIYIDFDPSKGQEINKRRPALVISRNEYSKSSNLIIVCPITSTKKIRPYLVPLASVSLKKGSKVNTKQVYTMDYSEQGNRNVQILGKVTKRDFLNIAQYFLKNFNFPF